MVFAHDILIKPVVTEKIMGMAAERKYVFKVAPKANKTQVKQAVEEIFNVKVKSINTMKVRGRRKRMGRFEGRTSNWKKAVVTLQDGYTIEMFEGM